MDLNQRRRRYRIAIAVLVGMFLLNGLALAMLTYKVTR